MKYVFLSLLLIGCAGQIPDKPVVELCVIDLPRNQLVCAPTGSAALDKTDYSKAIEYVRSHAERRTIPLSESNKYVCFGPTDWEAINVYTKKLRDYAVNMCK